MRKYLSITHNVCMCSVAQSCLTLCDPVDGSPPESSVHGIFQTRILEWVAISFSRESSQLMDRTHVSFVSSIGKQILYHWATWEAFVKSALWVFVAQFLC